MSVSALTSILINTASIFSMRAFVAVNSSLVTNFDPSIATATSASVDATLSPVSQYFSISFIERFCCCWRVIARAESLGSGSYAERIGPEGAGAPGALVVVGVERVAPGRVEVGGDGVAERAPVAAVAVANHLGGDTLAAQPLRHGDGRGQAGVALPSHPRLGIARRHRATRRAEEGKDEDEGLHDSETKAKTPSTALSACVPEAGVCGRRVSSAMRRWSTAASCVRLAAPISAGEIESGPLMCCDLCGIGGSLQTCQVCLSGMNTQVRPASMWTW